jgi:predicted permease
LIGLVFAIAGSRALIAALPESARAFLTAELDWRMMLFALLVTAMTALIAGLGPALQVTRPGLAGTIKDEGGAIMGGGKQMRVRRVLVGVQMALSVLLLVGATLFARSLVNVRAVDPGVTVDNTLSFAIDPGLSGYEGARVPQFYEQVRDAIRAIPGVRQAAVSEITLLADNSWRSTVAVDGYTNKDGEDMNPDFNGVSPDFFKTLGIPVTRGRDFTPSDVQGAQRVAVVSRAFSDYFFKNENPIGRTFHIGRATDPPITIVGEVRDIRSYSLRSEPVRFVYIPAYQDDTLGGSSFYVAHDPNATGITQAVRDAVRKVDPNVPVYDVLSFRDQFERSIVRERLVATLSSAFGVLATLLAEIGH